MDIKAFLQTLVVMIRKSAEPGWDGKNWQIDSPTAKELNHVVIYSFLLLINLKQSRFVKFTEHNLENLIKQYKFYEYNKY